VTIEIVHRHVSDDIVPPHPDIQKRPAHIGEIELSGAPNSNKSIKFKIFNSMMTLGWN